MTAVSQWRGKNGTCLFCCGKGWVWWGDDKCPICEGFGIINDQGLPDKTGPKKILPGRSALAYVVDENIKFPNDDGWAGWSKDEF